MSKYYGVASNYEYNRTHKRGALTVWSGQFCNDFEASGKALPGNRGYMLTLYGGGKLRVECPCPRTEENYREVDDAISDAMNNARAKEPVPCK
jgi:hypothetical protein